ncbi:MAG: CHAT domain-containing protein [Acidobacteriota bacterium]|nr:CHAT domain-containing protein [Acidobacteriota bacterium]
MRLVLTILLVWLAAGCSNQPDEPQIDSAQSDPIEAHRRAGRFDQAVPLMKERAEVLKQRAHISAEDMTLYLDCLNQIAWDTGVYLRRHREAETQLKAIIQYGERLDERHPELIRAHHGLAVMALYLGRLDESIAINAGLLALREEIHGPDSPQVAATLHNMSLAHSAQGDLDPALTYARRSLKLKQQFPEENKFTLANALHNLGGLYYRMGNRQLAVDMLEQALDYRSELPENHPDRANTRYMLGMTLGEDGDYPRALECLQQAAAESAVARKGMNPHHGLKLMELAKLQTLTGNPDAARRNLVEARDIIEQTMGKDDYHFAEVLNYQAWFHWQQQEWEQALAVIDEALSSLNYLPGTLQIQDNHTDEAFIRCLLGKSNILASRYNARADSEDLTKIEALAQDAQRMIETKRIGYLSQESQLVLNKIFQPLITLALEAAIARDEPETAFAWAEKSRMAVLHDYLRQTRAVDFGRIPPDLTARERALRQRLRRYQPGAHQGRNQYASDLVEAHNALDRFVKDLEQTYPDYYRLKYNTQTPDPISLCADLQPDQTLLAYHLAPAKLFIFSLTSQSMEAHEVPLSSQPPRKLTPDDWLHRGPGIESRSPLLQDARQLKSALVYGKSKAAAFYAKKLYERLIAPVQNHLAGDLIIIPAHQFGDLPFEVLQEHDGPSRYLIEDHAVSYSYSAELWTDSRPDEPFEPLGGIAFAPVFDGPTGSLRSGDEPVIALPESEREVNEISELFDRNTMRVFTRERATESNFKTNLKDAAIIHLATHGQIDPRGADRSKLLLADSGGNGQDGVLTLDEVYELEMKTRLLVLSACETGLGPVSGGEGILGFCRAFFYAGARAVMVSQWKVPDRSTTELMTRFYKNLLAGRSKTEALRRAKLALIAEGATPRQWAPFVIFGR